MKVCKWKYDNDGSYRTYCSMRYIEPDAVTNFEDFLYCPYCGKPILEIEEQDESTNRHN